jgi:Sulfotransferase domain.
MTTIQKDKPVQKPPFFIVGCVRSGTTLLRDVLRSHPNLVSPEETHFFRWSEPFGIPQSLKMLSGSNSVLKKHREMDRVSEAEFNNILERSVSRGDLQRKYMQKYLVNNNLEDKRWFDKTPQNVYGAALIADEFPGAKFIHIVRNPVDVVSSLRIGKVVKIENLVGACNYWNEAVTIVNALKKAYPHRVYEVNYEDFTGNFLPELEKMLAFLNEDFDPNWFEKFTTTPKEHDHSNLFKPEELVQIERLCKRWGHHYGYFK